MSFNHERLCGSVFQPYRESRAEGSFGVFGTKALFFFRGSGQRKTYVSGVRGVVEIIHIAAMFVQTVKQVR